MPAKEIPHVNPMKNRENRGKTGERPGKDRGKTGERLLLESTTLTE
jgi:hypothetical protein